jgi:two-component system LytT family sensor kinase
MNTPKNIVIIRSVKKGFIVCLKLTILFGIIFSIVYQQFSLKGIGSTFLASAMFSYGIGFGNGFLNDYLNTKWDWITQTKQRVTAGIIGTIIYTIPVVLGINYVIWIVIGGADIAMFFSGSSLFIHLFYIIISFGVSSFLHAKAFMTNWKIAMTQESTKQEIVAKTETAKFESLKSQLDPHFLFNSLNVLTSLIGENPYKAEKFTTQLSKVYRYVLEQRNKDLIPVLEEIKFANTYMELLGMRFEDAVKFEIPSSITNKNLKIVPLSLQLLLENAVKHNVVSSSKPLTIRIYEQDNYLIIENNINPKQAIGQGTKVGLRNIADRYGLITDKNVIIENNNKIFKVSLPLLLKMNNMIYSENLENSKYLLAVERVEKLKKFYSSLASFVVVMPFLIFINLSYIPYFQWFWFPLFGWSIGLVSKLLEANNYNIFLGKNWEEKKIKELMNDSKDK